ncbi:MAG: NADH-ubiquinone oxidoreductase [Sulfobacillus acidophilus]|uniref:NADH-ubiquinone oxidoreductase n=1 Tax=Sulfobacillus acidophilus TaxID=53633 RepID=A0A2T2WIE6_9FIRM|nr:MAG: NADH-ubiquinone oxidoreductase [Sulfobacillus acidophilus]
MPKSWIAANLEYKKAGYELLSYLATREGRLHATWLNPVDREQKDVSTQVVDNHFPSLTRQLPEVAWDEREIHDLFGYRPEGHPDLRPLIRTPRWPHDFYPLRTRSNIPPQWLDVEPDNPAKTVTGDGITIMKVGPTHAGIIESGHFVFSLIGENVLYLDAHLFQNHRGVELLLEDRTIEDVRRIVSRICAGDSVSHQTNWALAVETLARWTAEPPLALRRIILLECERVLSHLNDLAQIPAGVGFQRAHQLALAIKEYWQQGLKRLFGHRFLFDTVRPGEAAATTPDDLGALVRELRRRWVPWRRLVEAHHGFNDRMAGVGIVKPQDVTRFGAQGVVARAAGKALDARSILPLYDDMAVQFIQESAGDVKARFYVRVAELEESLRLLEESARRLRRWGSNDSSPFIEDPSDLSGRTVTFTESPHGLNVHDITLARGRVTRYHIRAGTYRNWPLLAHTVPGNAVADFPLINKSFELCYSCVDR